MKRDTTTYEGQADWLQAECRDTLELWDQEQGPEGMMLPDDTWKDLLKEMEPWAAKNCPLLPEEAVEYIVDQAWDSFVRWYGDQDDYDDRDDYDERYACL